MFGVGPTNAWYGNGIVAASGAWRGRLFVYCSCDMAVSEVELWWRKRREQTTRMTPIAEVMNQHTVFLYAECGGTTIQFPVGVRGCV
jgi:hypothetical protein